MKEDNVEEEARKEEKNDEDTKGYKKNKKTGGE